MKRHLATTNQGKKCLLPSNAITMTIINCCLEISHTVSKAIQDRG